MNWELPTISQDAPVRFTELYDFLPLPECQDEKRTMRQFMALLEQGEVPSIVSLEDITEWLSGEKCFIKKCKDCSQLGDLDQLTVVRAWYMKRRDQLEKIQQEILKEMERERHLSELFGRKVTMEELRRCMKMFRPSVETEVRHLLCPVFSGLPHSVMPSASHSISEGPDGPSFLQKAEGLCPKLVTTTFRHLLGGGAQGAAAWTSIEGVRATAAMEEIRWLLKDTLISALAPYGPVPVHKVVFTTAALARDVVRAVFEKFEVESSTFYLLNDSSCLGSMEETRKVVAEVTVEKKAKNMPAAESTSKCKEIVTLTNDPGTNKGSSIHSVETACNVKVINRGHKNLTDLATAIVDTKPSGKHLTGSQKSIASLVESCPDLSLKEVEATSAVGKFEVSEATKLAVEAGFNNTKKPMDRASSEMELMLLEDEPLLSINGIYPQEAPRLPVTSEVIADLCGGVTEECCTVGGEEKQDGGKQKRGVITRFLCRMKKLFTCSSGISKEDD